MQAFRIGVAIVLGALIAAGAGTAAAQTNARSPLGVNVRELRYWGTEMHTVDFFKRASNGAGGVWLTQCAWPCANGWNTGEQARLDLDANGWPRSLPAADAVVSYRTVATILWMNADMLPAGRWTVLYDGEGTLAYGQTGVVRNAAASTPGRDVFDVAAVPNAWLTLAITVTDPHKTGNYLRNIRVIPPGGTCNGDIFHYAADASACPSSYRALTETYASEPFHPQFLNDLRPFAALRFMQFSSTNLDQTTQWSERAQLADISWGYNSNRGAPFEVSLDIASTLDASPWLNIPAMAGDDYVVQFARLAKARLNTRRPIYLEYGNEVWNGVYPYSIGAQWAREQGKARWPNSAESDYAKGMNWFALRTKQICALWKQEFADRPGQVKCVMGSQGAGSWVTDHYELSCPLHAAEAGGTACNATAGIDAVAGGYYFGGHITDPVFQGQIEAEWFTQADGGLGKLFQEIADGSVLTAPPDWTRSRATVAQIAASMAANQPVAEKHGVEMIAYEGGNELFGRDNSAYQIQMQTLSERAQRDPRMAAAYGAVLNQWKANGGHLYMVFESTGRYSANRGNSTLLEWQGQSRDQAPKYDAVLRFIEGNSCWWAGCAVDSSIVFMPGWNLVGNGVEVPLAVAGLFGDADRVTSVWKWLASGGAPDIRYPAWAFYSPALADGGQLYAANRNYGFLTTINGGEGFWVYARKAFAIPLPPGAPVAAASFRPAVAEPALAGGAHALPNGWSLVATGDSPVPAQFDAALATALTMPPAAGQAYSNLISLWAWDAARTAWYFWAPSLVNNGGLAGYLASKGYLDFTTLPTTPAGTLSPATGFWVNMP